MKAVLVSLCALFLLASPLSNAIAGDGVWDSDKGGIDRDMDNDGVWDYGSGGIDRDVDVPF